MVIQLLAQGQQQTQQALNSISGNLERMEKTSRQAGESMDRTSKAVAKIGHYGLGLGFVVPALTNMARQAIQAADAVTTLRNRLELATGGGERAAAAFESLFSAAQRSRTSFTELGSVYATLARAGFQNVAVVEAIGNAMSISGGSAQGMQAALVQLGQGLSSGVLRGEELNSVMEQAPRLAQALADGLGVPIGALRRMGEQGELSAKQVVGALMKSAPQLAEEVKNSTSTVGQSFTVLSNATTRFISEIDQATGASKGLSQALVGVGNGLTAIAGF
ncbi:MAG: tape measure protein, partial [Burkholderiaceae bacterium]|nr:tape measure protein [Burkholderiaceae bacterium]